MLKPEDLTYHVVRSPDLRPSHHNAINKLLAASLRRDFHSLNEKELTFLVAQSAAFRRNPNWAVGGMTIRKGQSYARPIHVLAVNEEDEIVASLPMADNASASSSQRLPAAVGRLLGGGERFVKLYMPFAPLGDTLAVQKRYRWSGLFGVSDEVHDSILHADPDVLHIGQAVLMAGYHGRYADQPASAYPYTDRWEEGGDEGEEAWLHTLVSSDFHPVGEPETIRPFGSDREVCSYTMRVDSLRDFRDNIRELAGAEAVRHQIVYHLPEVG